MKRSIHLIAALLLIVTAGCSPSVAQVSPPKGNETGSAALPAEPSVVPAAPEPTATGNPGASALPNTTSTVGSAPTAEPSLAPVLRPPTPALVEQQTVPSNQPGVGTGRRPPTVTAFCSAQAGDHPDMATCRNRGSMILQGGNYTLDWEGEGIDDPQLTTFYLDGIPYGYSAFFSGVPVRTSLGSHTVQVSNPPSAMFPGISPLFSFQLVAPTGVPTGSTAPPTAAPSVGLVPGIPDMVPSTSPTPAPVQIPRPAAPPQPSMLWSSFVSLVGQWLQAKRAIGNFTSRGGAAPASLIQGEADYWALVSSAAQAHGSDPSTCILSASGSPGLFCVWR